MQDGREFVRPARQSENVIKMKTRCSARSPVLRRAAVIACASPLVSPAVAQDHPIDRLSAEGETQVIAWRRDFHQFPELSNREFRTSEVVAEALREMGLEVETGIAHTGVVGYLRGARERPLVAIRADMDALPVTVNDPELTQRMLPTIERVVGRENMVEEVPRTGAEDFFFFALEVPGFYVGLGVTPPDIDPATAPTNHSPLFYVDEAALVTGVRVLSHLALDYMAGE